MNINNFQLLLLAVFKLVLLVNCTEEEDLACEDGLSCMSFADCTVLLRSKQQDRDKILFVCNYSKLKLCCPPSEQTTQPNNTDNKGSKIHANMHLLPNEKCGFTSTSKISGGQNADLGQFPWMALLGARLNNGTLLYICGGTIISDQYILTAAHCLQQVDATLESVRLGEHNLNTKEDCVDYCADPVQDYEIEKTISHDKYDPRQIKNDIALVRLKNKVPQYTDFIRPICLPFGIEVTGKEEKKYSVAGWGKVNYYDSKGSAVLQFAHVNSIPLEDCDAHQNKAVRPLEETQLCAAGNRGEDSCKGDSGGPLMDIVQLPTRRSAQTFQMGVVSFGSIPCGANTSPSVYTKVSAYLEWILDHIQE